MNRYKTYRGKRILDISVAFSLLALSMPLFLLIALLIKLFNGSPVIYYREAIGLWKQPFFVFKFRSMVNGAEVREEDIYQMTGGKSRRTTPE